MCRYHARNSSHKRRCPSSHEAGQRDVDIHRSGPKEQELATISFARGNSQKKEPLPGVWLIIYPTGIPAKGLPMQASRDATARDQSMSLP